MGDRTSERSAVHAAEIREIVARLEPVIARLRERMAHCQELARRATPNDVAKELLVIARDCENDADRLEASMMFITEPGPT
jgi:hypothetical protein